MFKPLFTLVIISCLGACANNTDSAVSIKDAVIDGQVICTEPRAQMCTREYRPVCANKGGVRVTYATGCTACADPKVASYQPDACQ